MKEDSESKTTRSQEFVEVDEESDEDLSDDDDPKRSKKRKSPPKGGSFGPTVGGF